MAVESIGGHLPSLALSPDLKTPLAKPSDFQAPPQTPAAPEGLSTRNSADSGMAPRMSLGDKPGGAPGAPGAPGSLPGLPNLPYPTNVKDEADNAMDKMKDLANTQMKFQIEMGVLNLHKGFAEGLGKQLKSIGDKTAAAAA